jgi:hypothetical protein
MIDELVKVADAMDAAGIAAKDWHSKFKTLPKANAKSPCVRIWLAADGSVADIEALPDALVSQLRKYEPDAGKSLPGFNVCPLYRIVKDGTELKNANKALAAAVAQPGFLWDEQIKGGEDFWDRTRSVLKQLKNRVLPSLEKICEGRLQPDETLAKFFEVFGRLDIETFKQTYEEKAKVKVRDGLLPQSLVCYFVDEAKKKKEDTDSNAPIPKISVFLDIKEYKEFPVSHEKSIARLNELLMGAEGTKSPTTTNFWDTSLDAYGASAVGSDDKFAQVAVPALGGVILRSQVAAVPAQARYHLCDFSTFPVGTATRERIKAALEWVSATDRKGETFGTAGDKELLFAFPEKLPPSKVPLASLFGAHGPAVTEVVNTERFEALAKTVIGQLKGMGDAAADAELNIFSLRKMDKARTKVVYYRNMTVDSLEKASEAWSFGFQNIPDLDIRDWSETKKENGKSFTVSVETQTLFPLKLHKILNTVWTLDKDNKTGARQSAVKIFEPSAGLSLLLDSSDVSLVSYVTERFLNHAQTYFVVLCRAKGRNEIAGLPDKSVYPGILGLLLYKLGKTKETYMNESAYQLGRFLRVADEIHRLYCEVVRTKKDGKPDLPPELCGSSLLTSMLESPARTLDQLCMRSAPYVKWARACHGDEKGGLVHYWMRQWSQIADALHEIKWPPRPTPEERAQIFLGYLSSFPKSESTVTDSSEGGQK